MKYNHKSNKFFLLKEIIRSKKLISQFTFLILLTYNLSAIGNNETIPNNRDNSRQIDMCILMGLSPTYHSFSPGGETYEVMVEMTGVGCTPYVSSKPSWVSTQISGSAPFARLDITAQPNTGSLRNGLVSVKYGSITKSITISQGEGVQSPPLTPGSISGNTSPCINNRITYSVSPVTGATSYNWSATNGTIYGNGNSSIEIEFSSAGSKTVSVTASNSAGTSPASTTNITVGSPPGSASISGPQSPTEGSTETYTCSAAATSYSWSLPSGWTIISDSNSPTIIVSVSDQDGIVTANYSNNCGSSSASISVNPTTTPSTPGSITGSSSPCKNSSASYSISPVTGATGYTWIAENGSVSGSGTNVSITFSASGYKTISVSAYNDAGTSNASTREVQVQSSPSSRSISGDSTPTIGYTSTYSCTSYSGESYSWSVPSGSTITSGQGTNSISVRAGTSSGNVRVDISNSCGSTSPYKSVSPVPSRPVTIYGISDPCQNTSVEYSINSVTGATSYNWSAENGTVYGSGLVVDIVFSSPGDNQISVSASNSAGTSSKRYRTVTVKSPPSSVGNITGEITPCQGTSKTYSVNYVSGVSYSWSVPSGWTITSGQGSSSITTTVGTSSGQISVTPDNSCGDGPASVHSVVVSPLPSVGDVTGPSTPKKNGQATYSCTSSNIDLYSWTVPSDWTIISDENSSTIIVQVGNSSGSISVEGTNTCGSNQSQQFSVVPIDPPVTPELIIGSQTTCTASSESYGISEVPGATEYIWTAEDGTITGSGTSVSIVFSSSGSKNISVSAKNSAGTSNPREKTILVKTIPSSASSIIGESSPCLGDTITYSVTNISNTDYNWVPPLNWNIIDGQGTSTITIKVGSNSGTLAVTPSNDCGSASSSTTLAVSVQNENLQAAEISTNKDDILSGNELRLEITKAPVNCSGNYTNKWEKSEDLINWSDCNANSTLYIVHPIANTHYRLKTISKLTNDSVTSNSVLINIVDELLPGSICCDDTIQSGQQPLEFTSEEDAREGLEPYIYEWEMMDDTLVGWLPIDTATRVNYQPDILLKTTWFRRSVTDNLTAPQQAWTDSVCIFIPSDTAVVAPVALKRTGDQLKVHKGKHGLNGKWEWFNSYKGQALDSPKDSILDILVTRPTRYRARAKYKVKNPQGGDSIEMKTYFVSAKVEASENLDLADKNYILTYTPVEGKSTYSTMKVLPLEKQGAVVQYFDGLGRPEQTIAVNHSYYFNDLVTGVDYDEFGRKNKNYIPSTVHGLGNSVANLNTNINNFYIGVNGSPVDGLESNSGVNYTYTHYENSPLNRVKYVEDPKGGRVTYEYGMNDANTVRIWTVDNSGNCANTDNAYYVAGELFHTKITDANGKITEEYKDKLGQVVLKIAGETAKTYYVYDNFGLLCYVLSPKATAAISGSSYSSGSTEVKGLCYYYEYDDLKRMTAKQLPGAEPVYMVYDVRDRLVLIQDGKTRDENGSKWLYTKYDDFNRPVETGWMSTTDSHSDLQTAFENSVSFPYTTSEVLTQTSYDNYVDTPFGVTPNQDVKGMITRTVAKKLDNSGDVITDIFYDDKYRVIQTKISGSPIAQTVTNTYDFVGNLTKSVETYTDQVNAIITKDYTYDHAGRLEKVEQLIDNDSYNGKVVLIENSYNALGQLMLKKLHSANDTSFVQNIDYLYDVRGWLTSINNFQDSIQSKLYAQSLEYFSNGNISNVEWKNTIMKDGWVDPTNKLKYAFTYDALNRLDDAAYIEYLPAGGSTNSGSFNTNYGYDPNGNIASLQRDGNKNISGATPSYGLIDNLTYTYPTTSNLLTSVSDAATGVNHDLEFKEVAGNYVYDDSGNATTVPGKGSVEYNYLNLPERVFEGTDEIKYLYDASGNKLKKTYNSTASSYYQGSVLKLDGESIILTGEGRVVYANSMWNYEYDLKDHLGNTRVSFGVDTIRAVPLQYKDYYPFGMEMARWYTIEGSPTKFLYNGKELQDEEINGNRLDWYDYGARFYDPSLGRWHVIDNKAEKYAGGTPYAYSINNPIRFIDPDGNDIVDATGKPITYSAKAGWSQNATAGAKRIGNAMMATQTGTAQWNKMATSSTKIQLEVSQATKVNGRTYTLGQMIPGKQTIDGNGKFQLVDAKVVIYEGTINKFMNDSKNSKIDTNVSYQMNTTNNDERIGAVAGHEAEHTTEENVQQNYENQVKGTSHDLEKKPVEIEMKILEETGLKNIKPIEPIKLN